VGGRGRKKTRTKKNRLEKKNLRGSARGSYVSTLACVGGNDKVREKNPVDKEAYR